MARTYEIRTLPELQAVMDDLAGHYVLMNDIDASETKTWNDGAGFEPIGTGDTPFTGVFDGNGKKIIGLTINRPKTNNVGLFGYTGKDCTIKDLGLEGGSVRGSWYVGGLVGCSDGTITTCYVTGRVSGDKMVGGLVGYSQGTITTCYYDSQTTGQSDTGKGEAKTTEEIKQQATFEGWDFTKTWQLVEGMSYPYLREFGEECSLVVSAIGSGTVRSSGAKYSYGETVSLIATPSDGYVFDGWLGRNVADATTASTTMVMDSHKSAVAYFRKMYEIRTLAELQAVKDDLAGHYVLMNDIDASETREDFEPLGWSEDCFTGVFDGNGKIIKGLHINRGKRLGVGLFGYTGKKSIIKNLGLENCEVLGGGRSQDDCGDVYVGGLVGHSSERIERCYTNNCELKVNEVECTTIAGGLVGYSDGSIEDCYVRDSDVECANKWSGDSCIGGLVGYDENGYINNCYATGRVSGADCNRGLVGNGVGVGPLVGYYNSDTAGLKEQTEEARTTDEMKRQSTFEGWDFEKVWTIDEGADSPRLIWPPNDDSEDTFETGDDEPEDDGNEPEDDEDEDEDDEDE